MIAIIVEFPWHCVTIPLEPCCFHQCQLPHCLQYDVVIDCAIYRHFTFVDHVSWWLQIFWCQMVVRLTRICLAYHLALIWIYIYMYISWYSHYTSKFWDKHGGWQWASLFAIGWLLFTWSYHFLYTVDRNNWGVFCQKQMSRTETSNYIPQYMWDVITCLRPWDMLLTQHISIIPHLGQAMLHPETLNDWSVFPNLS